jgi:hypothetical protein
VASQLGRVRAVCLERQFDARCNSLTPTSLNCALNSQNAALFMESVIREGIKKRTRCSLLQHITSAWLGFCVTRLTTYYERGRKLKDLIIMCRNKEIEIFASS